MEMKAEIKGVELHGEDLEGFDHVFDSATTTTTTKTPTVAEVEEGIWFPESSTNPQHNLNSNNNNQAHTDVVVDEGDDGGDLSSLFYTDFPPLPDFPCMSSSSSSSSIPPQAKPSLSTATSSSASSGTASWAMLRSDAEHDPAVSLSSPAVSMDFMDTVPNEGGGSCVVGEGSVAVPDDVEECMDMMENLGCIDLLDNSEDICWDPSPLFNEHEHEHDTNQQQQHPLLQAGDDCDEEERVFEQFMLHHDIDIGGGCNSGVENNSNNNNNLHQRVQQPQDDGQQQQASSPSDDLAMVFFEWLKSNKEAVSAEDLRNIKIKKSTIEAAAKRLGGGKEGMKQLLKLILQWVQNHHLQTKRTSSLGIIRESSNVSESDVILLDDNSNNNNNNSTVHETAANPNPNPSPNPNLNANGLAWLAPPPPPPPQFVSDPAAMVPPPPLPSPGFGPMVGYDGYSNGPAYTAPVAQPDQYHPMLESTPIPWPGHSPMQYGVGPGAHYAPYGDPGYGGYGAPQYPSGYFYNPVLGEGLVRLGSSATKEARKKRMARQRRFFTHHHKNTNNNNISNNNLQLHPGNQCQMMSNHMSQPLESHVGSGSCGGVVNHGQGSWMYWPPSQMPPPQVNHSIGGMGNMVGQMHHQHQQQLPLERPGTASGNVFQRQGGVEKKQGWKTEKNLRFLLQKVLKQSDVGNLGRIVLPKKEAETHLPELEARDGIPIAMEDIGTSRVWNMRYRFWPNNKSRMYLLENTGDFVRSNGLQEGDFIVIYSDVKCGKYMIRGVKVRPQQQGAKSEAINKKPSKTQKTQDSSSPAGNGSSDCRNAMQLLSSMRA